jgi:hypothetical protein
MKVSRHLRATTRRAVRWLARTVVAALIRLSGGVS